MKTMLKCAMGCLVLGVFGVGLAQSTTGSFRHDLEITKTLVAMSAPRQIQIDGLKSSFAYTFTMTDMNRKFSGQSTYNLVLGSADGTRMSMFTLSYKGPAAEPGFSTFGQVVGHLGRHCLGLPETTLRAVATDFSREIEASSNQKSAVRSVSKRYGSIILIGQNIQLSNSGFSFVFYLSNTAQPGTGSWKTTCLAKI